ncbi:potassium channel family protein [Aquimarina agarivorans]|uniref:potassium channel family protein n=1 Tax=Aquimarina agarivorans TaxID=980584 RepID=UPI000248F269|nr:NAD-binding protein [Aquimarina agarivorans]
MLNPKKIITFLGFILGYNLLVYQLYVVESNFPDGNINNIADAYWYSLVTLTTVGYGDFYPVSFWGRLIGFLFVIGSLGILGYLLTELNLRIKEYLKNKEMGLLGTKNSNHCIIIGWNSFSKQVAEQIVKAKEPLAIIVDNEEDLKQIKQLYNSKTCFVLQTELNDFESLKKANIESSKRVYINFDNDTDTLVYSISLKKQYENLKCVVAIENSELKESFNYLGIQYIIPRKEIISKFIASYVFEPNVALLTEDLIATSNSATDIDICETKLSSNSPLVGKNYTSAFIEQKEQHNIVLLAVSRKGQLIKNPSNEFTIQAEDILIYMANGVQKELIAG